MSTDIEERKKQLGLLARELAPLLDRGLSCRLQDSADCLDGVQAGVDSIRALLEMSRLVSCGNREQDRPREEMLRQLCAQLARFSRVQDVQARVGILLDIQCPMEMLLVELCGLDGPGDTGLAPLVLQLSSGVGRLLERAETFTRMAQELSVLTSVKYFAKRQARREGIAEFCERYAAYAALLDFQDGAALEEKACRDQLTEWLEAEARDLLSLAWRVHEQVYAGDRAARATGDWRLDLGEDALRPVLASLLEPARDMLARLCRLFEEAVEIEGGDLGLYRRFTTLGLEIDEFERSAA